MTRYSGNIVKAQLPGASVAGASGNWELEDAAQQIGSGAWPAAVGLNDPNFYQNALLLNGDGTNGAQNNTFLDSSTNNFTITRNGNATQGSFTPFGGANYSAYFDGTGDYLSVATSSGLAVGTGDFTIECWAFHNDSSAYSGYFWGNASGLVLRRTNANKLEISQDGVAGILVSTATIPTNQWVHVAATRSGTTVRLFINGTLDSSATSSANFASTAAATVGSISTVAGYYMNGHISNLRIIKGTALYTANFTTPTAPLNTTSNTSLLTCASQSFEDLSATNAAVTRNGDTRITESSPFNSYSRTPVSYGVALNGTTDFLSVGTTPTLATTTTPFTIECWVYPTVQLSGTALFSTNFTGGGQAIPFCIFGATNISTNTSGSNLCAGYYTGSAWVGISSTTSLTLNQWSHVALVFNGTVATLYLNGVSIGSATTSWTTSTATPFLIGRRWDTTATPYFGGSISNLRFVAGSAIYTANFTPPTAPLTAVSGTQLLTCQDTTFKDNSGNALSITLNGTPRPVKSNPFGYTIALGLGYNPTTMGGSGYFDGTGDFLNFTGGTATSLNADFTIEGWLYANSFAVTQIILCIGDDFANPGVAFYVGTDGKLGIFYGNARALTGTTVAAANTWHHVAFVRSGSTITGYLNGVPQGTVTNSSTFSGTTTYIGGELYNGTAGGRNNGYVAGLRLVKGTALYTGPFVPPQAPVTAVTNTQLLLNFANGGIVDYATGTTFETVSGAKISTTTKKYGTGSIAFNGTSDYLRAPFNPNLNFGTGNFTVECWVYVASSANSDQTIIASNQSWAAGAVLVKAYQTGNVSFSAYDYNSGGTAMVSSAATLNTWVHVALVRNGNTFTLYLNGTSAATQTSTIAVNFAPTNGTYIGHAGAINPTTGYLNGYIDDLRISRYARYTANFTPPTSALQIF